MTAAAEIHAFIVGELTQGRDVGSVNHEDELLTLGIIDSHGIMELIAFLEERFGITIDDDDLTPENFTSIATIEQFLARSTVA